MNRLSDAEWKIMKLLWDNAPMTITELTRALFEETGWTKYTIITYLKRMEAKGAVYHTEDGRAKQFFPMIDRTDTEIKEIRFFLDKVFDGELETMLSTMVEGKALKKGEIKQLRKFLKKLS